MAAHRLLRPTLLTALACLALSCGRAYPLDAGCYEMTATEVLRDDCGLLSKQDLWDGSLLMTGRVVRLDYELKGMQLIGYFLADTDAFALDGSLANVQAKVNDQLCLLDQMGVHMEGSPVGDSYQRFDGVLRVRYDARRPESCVCELWTRFTAQHTPDSDKCADQIQD